MNAWWLYRPLSLLAIWLPRRTAYAAARPFAGWAYRHHLVLRKTVAANLRVVLESRGTACSESELEKVVRRNFENFGKYLVDFFQAGRPSPVNQHAIIRADSPDYLPDWEARGKGLIGVTAHLGSWEWGIRVIAGKGWRVNAVVLPQPTARLDALFQSRRTRRGVQVLPMAGAAVTVPACLRRNEFVAMLADQDFSSRKDRVSFFGKPARLPRGPAVLAARSGAPVLPAFILRQPDDTFCFRTHPPIVPDGPGSIGHVQKHIVTVLEEVIGNHPDQWFAFKPVWE